MGDEIRAFARKVEQDNPMSSDEALVKSAWASVVDEATAKHITGVFVVPDTDAHEVLVYVDTSLWTTELSMQAEFYRFKLNMEIARRRGRESDLAQGATRVEAEQVRKLRFVTSRQNYVSKRSRQTTYEQLKEEQDEYQSIEPIGLSAEEEKGLESAVAGVSDERLRRAAYEAAKASIEFQKGLDKHDWDKQKHSEY